VLNLPGWIERHVPVDLLSEDQKLRLASLADGEREAISMTLALKDALLLIDERAGRNAAQ